MFSPSTMISSSPFGLFWLVLLVVLVVCTILGLQYLTSPRRRRATFITDNVALSTKPILTEAEARFFRSLEQAVDGDYLVWPQLPLWTFVDVRSNDRGAAATVKNQINLKRVDFCLVNRETRAVRTAIELDDRSHDRLDRRVRDAFVETVLKQAGIPLIRVSAAQSYDSQVIQMQLGLEKLDGNRKKLGAIL